MNIMSSLWISVTVVITVSVTCLIVTKKSTLFEIYLLLQVDIKQDNTTCYKPAITGLIIKHNETMC